MPSIQTRADREIRAAYKLKPFVGWYRVLAGRHSEGDRTFGPGDVVHTKSSVLVPGDRDKFQEIIPTEAQIKAEEKAVAEADKAVADAEREAVELSRAIADAEAKAGETMAAAIAEPKETKAKPQSVPATA